jgi:1-acyl-sn-glycerol-3-phosphate acyltransferase
MIARALFNALAIALLTLFWSVGAMFAAVLDRRGGSIPWIERVWARMVLKACGIRVEVEGADQTFDAPAYLVMANHTSYFDVISLCASVPIPLRFVAKRELGHIPFLGWAMRLGAAIMIDRGDREKAIASIQRAGRSIREGRSVLMFPEGTRTPPDALGPMKKGPFHLALEALVPVLPVGLSGTGEVLPKGDWRIRPGRVTVRIGKPIDTGDLPHDDAARAGLEERVAAALSSLMTPRVSG